VAKAGSAMTRMEISFDDYDAECLTFLAQHFDTEGEHVVISDFPRYEELGREHIMKVVDRFQRFQIIEFLNRGTITILPQLLSVAEQLRVPEESIDEHMSVTDVEISCLNRLAEIFESGTTQTSVSTLFDGMDIDNGQKHSVCESLKSRRVINSTYQMGQKLPYFIEILPSAVEQCDRHSKPISTDAPAPAPRTMWETIHAIALLWFGDPNARFAKLFAIAGVALIAAPWWQPVLQQFAVRYLGIQDTLLADADSTMFWSGWVFVAIALGLYIWIKRLQTQKKRVAGWPSRSAGLQSNKKPHLQDSD
jgi:hypothetical protein